ncbi:MAG: PHP domain-containing protein [Clostridia bacterium]|nr:PHP domain-containing protein [Clostridia bacterium]
MEPFSYDLHVHSCLSPCGDDDMTPCNIAGMAFLNGLKIVALTDHNSCKNCPAFFTACAEYGLVPIAGMELTTAEEIHMVCLFEELETALRFDEELQKYRMQIKNRVDIFGSQPIMGPGDTVTGEDPWFLPAATMLPIEEAAALVRSFGGICYPAHIDRESNGLLAVLGTFPEKPVFGLAELRERKNTALAEGRKLVVSSDAHRLWELNGAENFLHLDASAEDGADTIRAAFFRALRAAEAEWER